jgi:hypothetical protein
MLDDLDRTLQELLKHELASSRVDPVTISFATPDREFPPSSLVLPAIDLFLYDVRENAELRSPEWRTERRLDGTAVRQRAPVRVDCSYLITAWSSETSATRAIEEHKLLSQTMRALLRYPVIPEVLLQGDLRRQEHPPPTSTLQSGRLQSPIELWQALGGKPKASLSYTVTIGLQVDRPVETEVPVLESVVRFGREA